MRPGPIRPLTPRQRDALRALTQSRDYDELGVRIGVSAGRAKNLIEEIADLLPNPDQLPALRLVLIYAGYALWAADHGERLPVAS